MVINNKNQSNIYFTSDLHLGHGNIIKYCNRPFKDANEMDYTITKNFTDILQKGDILYILGDLSFKKYKAEEFLKLITTLGVKIHFILGNHDKDGRLEPVLQNYCESIQEIKEININGTHITLCHYPMQSWNKSHYGAWHLYGHVHGRKRFEIKQYDVGVDVNDYKPISFTQLQRIMKYKLTQKKNG